VPRREAAVRDSRERIPHLADQEVPSAYAFASVTNQRTGSAHRLGSLGSGAVTALALAVQQGLAAVVGVVIAREFGRGAETDGFFAAYSVFVVLALAATASRAVLLPPLARAREQGRLGAETTAYGVALAAVALPLLVVSIVGADGIATLLTGFDDGEAGDTAARLLPWLVLAAVGQLYAGLAASALAALDDYATAAAGYAAGSVLGLLLILWRVGDDGIDAVAWGMALNAGVAVVVPTLGLVARARREAVPSSAARPASEGRSRRLGGLAAGVALPLALQAVYLICVPFAAGEGVGALTSFGYAFLAASAVISVTASALALVTSVPLTRAGLDPVRVARHVDSSAWIALVAVGATAGVFAVAGEPLADAVLGGAYGNDVGEELGRFVVALAPWMLVTVGISAAFPLVFVARQGSRLPLVALVVVAVHAPLAWLGDLVAGVYGLAIALAISTCIGLVGVLVLLGAAAATLRGLVAAALVVATLAVVAFLPPALVLGAVPAAVVGVALYGALLLLTRPRGLTDGWRYLRALA
jgi:hypothetical protein